MKTLLLACLAGAVSILPATTASAADAAPGDRAPNPDQQQVSYDNNVMNDDRVIAGSSTARGGTSTYQGDWSGAYREDGTYQGEWRGTYSDRDGKLYDGQYAGTFIGEGHPYPAPSPQVPHAGASHAAAAPEPAPLPASAATKPIQAGADYETPQYVQAPAQPAPAAPAVNQQTPPQYRYPNGWSGYYYPPHFPPATTTIVIHTAPGATTTTTYYEE